MKTKIIQFVAFLSINLLYVNTSHAQLFNRLKNKVESKIGDKADEAIDKAFSKKDPEKTDQTTIAQATSSQTTTSQVDNSLFTEAAKSYNFGPGNTIVFKDNFSNDSLGSMAYLWKTSGSGEVERFSSRIGRWLSLKEFTSYKIKSDNPLPNSFTIEFDIATHSNTSASDLKALAFGFTHDNNINDYISDAYNDNAITGTQIHYWNKAINNTSSDTKINNSIQFPLAAYAVGIMHVAIKVNGEVMQVFLDKVKVLDTQMFLPTSKTKYFYISTSTSLNNGAKIGISNFVIASL